MIKVYQTKFYNRETQTGGNSFVACIASLLEIPLRNFPSAGVENRDEAFQAITDMLCDFGMKLGGPTKTAPDGYCIRVGLTNDNTPHAVILFDGAVVHNPHPLGPGVTRLADHWTIDSIDEAYHGQ